MYASLKFLTFTVGEVANSDVPAHPENPDSDNSHYEAKILTHSSSHCYTEYEAGTD